MISSGRPQSSSRTSANATDMQWQAPARVITRCQATRGVGRGRNGQQLPVATRAVLPTCMQAKQLKQQQHAQLCVIVDLWTKQCVPSFICDRPHRCHVPLEALARCQKHAFHADVLPCHLFSQVAI